MKRRTRADVVAEEPAVIAKDIAINSPPQAQRRETQRKRTLGEATDDMDRALREHEPEAEIARCTCGNVAMAIVQNGALGMRYVRCLGCGANVTLRFTDAGGEP